MRQRIYYLAFLKLDMYEYSIYQWYMSLVDPDRVDEYLTDVQIEHLKNRLVGGWRGCIPFNITWELGNMEFLD